MKRRFALILVLAMFLSLVACSNNETESITPSEPTTPTVSTEASTDATETPTGTPATPTEATQAPTEKPTVMPTEAPTAAPTEVPTAAPTEVPTAAPTEAPTAAPTEPAVTEPQYDLTVIGDVIPAGGVYVFSNSNDFLLEGSFMPKSPTLGDYFYYGDYRYEYVFIHNKYGWDVYAESIGSQSDKSSYNQILLSINGYPIIAMTSTFHSNSLLKKAPAIPDTVVDMTQTFHSCTALVSAPRLPKDLLTMQTTFAECTALKTYEGAKNATAAGDFTSYGVPSGVADWCILDAFHACPQIKKLPRGLSNVTDAPTVTPSATKPPATEKPTAAPTTKPTVPEPANVLIISDTQTISNKTINSDVYITSTGVATFKNVTVNGNIYCHGQLKANGVVANDVFAYAYGSTMSCGAFDGAHGKISGSLECNKMTIDNDALDYAFEKWGKKEVSTVTPPETQPTKPPVTEKPTAAPTTKPTVPEPANVLIISDTQTISNQVINTDVYITSTGVATFKNVTVNGNIYCYGQLQCSSCVANDVFAYAYGSMMSCGAFDGTHGKISGGLTCNAITILDNALDYAFAKWGKK